MKKLLLIINPKSGVKKNERVFKDVQEIISNNEWKIETVYTTHRGHATEITQAAIGYDRIVCMGGDGTFNETANGLLSNPLVTDLGYIPAGSTNDLANGLGLSKKIKRSAKFSSCHPALPTDMGIFTADKTHSRYFSYVASFGIFSNISYSTDQKIKNRFGHMAYIFEGIRSISELHKFKPFKMRVEFSSTDAFESEFIFGAITNSTSIGGLVKLDRKKVHVNDGLFEVILIRKPQNLSALTETITNLLNNRFDSQNIFFGHVSKLRLISPTPIDWTVDGEYAGAVSVADISVKKDALNIVRPASVRYPFIFKKKP